MYARSLLCLCWIFASACAVRAPQTYRLVPVERTRVLVPPGVVNAAAPQIVLDLPVALWKPVCTPNGDALRIQPRGRTKVRITINRERLLQQPAGWLRQWATDSESQGCLATGVGLEFATRILDSLPLDPAAAYRLLHADNISKGYIDLGLEDRLQVVSPILKTGAAADAPILETASASGTDRQINLSVRTTDNLIGIETAWYTFQPRPDHVGSTIVPVSAERSIAGKKELADAPITNLFSFAPSAAFYRLFYKTDPTDSNITEIVVAAPSRAELDRRTARLISDFSLCQKSDPEMCIVVPRRVAVNPFMTVTVNGAEVRLAVGSRIRQAIQTGGGPRNPADVIPSLVLAKVYRGKLTLVDFDRTRSDIIDLTLLGGESITWK